MKFPSGHDHLVSINTTFLNPRWWGTCTCGWKGEERQSEVQAQTDLADHLASRKRTTKPMSDYELVRVSREMVERLIADESAPVVVVRLERLDDGTCEMVFRTSDVTPGGRLPDVAPANFAVPEGRPRR